MTKMRKAIFTCLLIQTIFCYSYVYSSDDIEKGYGAKFLQQLSSAEINGMGEGAVAHSTGVRALNNNPAGLAFGAGNELLVGSYRSPDVSATIMKENINGIWEDYGRYKVDPNEMAYINYAIPTGRIGKIGISFAFGHGGRFIRVNEEGKAINAFPNDDILFGIGYGVGLGKGLALGFDAKALRSKLSVDEGIQIGRTYAMNVGFMHQISNKARIGMSLQNMGKDLSFKTSDVPSKLRRDFHLGALCNVVERKKSKLSVSFDVNPPFEDGLRYSIGSELLYADCLALRIGYMRDSQPHYDAFVNISDGSSISDERIWVRQGITFGAGLKLKSADINLAITPSRSPALYDGEKLRLEDGKSVISLSFSARL